jgi:hypothetical protein
MTPSTPRPLTRNLEVAVDAFTAAYRENFPAQGDEQDHDEATRCGVEAVLALADSKEEAS